MMRRKQSTPDRCVAAAGADRARRRCGTSIQCFRRHPADRADVRATSFGGADGVGRLCRGFGASFRRLGTRTSCLRSLSIIDGLGRGKFGSGGRNTCQNERRYCRSHKSSPVETSAREGFCGHFVRNSPGEITRLDQSRAVRPKRSQRGTLADERRGSNEK